MRLLALLDYEKTTMTEKNKGGRPATGHEKPRILGRVADDEWTEVKTAAERSGKSFTRWAMEILLRAARRAKS